MANSADPDQLASSEANWSGSTLFAMAGHIQVPCFFNRKYLFFLFLHEKKKKNIMGTHQNCLSNISLHTPLIWSYYVWWTDLICSFTVQSTLLRSCWTSQLTYSHFTWTGLDLYAVNNQYFLHGTFAIHTTVSLFFYFLFLFFFFFFLRVHNTCIAYRIFIYFSPLAR